MLIRAFAGIGMTVLGGVFLLGFATSLYTHAANSMPAATELGSAPADADDCRRAIADATLDIRMSSGNDETVATLKLAALAARLRAMGCPIDGGGSYASVTSTTRPGGRDALPGVRFDPGKPMIDPNPDHRDAYDD